MPRKKTPGSRLPRRYMKGGKQVGNYYLRIAGHDVNLRTKNAELALLRAKEARAGQRAFAQDDGDGAARAVAATVVGTDAAQSAPVVEPPAPAVSGLSTGAPPPATPQGVPPMHTAPAALPPPEGQAPPPNAPSASSARPDAYLPPPPGWGAAVGEAAGEAGGAGDAPDLPPEFLDEIMGVLADVAVEAQLMLQAWLIRRKAKLEASHVPPGAKAREVGRKLWGQCIKNLFPSDIPLPDWLIAPLMVAALSVPVQLQGAKPANDAEDEGAAGASSPASSAAAA